MGTARRSDAKGSTVFLHPCTLAPIKRCSKCQQAKPVDQFTADARRRDGLRPQCRECGRANTRDHYRRNRESVLARTSRWAKEHPESGRETARRWREANREKLRERKREEYARNGEEIRATLRDAAFRRKYGISTEQREAMAAAQDHRCAICGRPEEDFSKALAIDHDHATGAVRALLCEHCNNGLGRFQDDPELLERAAEYLRHHKGARHDEVT